MKKTFLLFILITGGLIVFGQSQPENLEIGLFKSGTHSGNDATSPGIEFALKPVNATYKPIPVAEDLIIYLVAPKSDFAVTDVVNISATNKLIYGETGTMLPQKAHELGEADPGNIYFPIVLQSPAGMSLNSLEAGKWSFAFNITFTPVKSQEALNRVKIVDQTNNEALSAFAGQTLFTNLVIGTVNQLTRTAVAGLPLALSGLSLDCSDNGVQLSWSVKGNSNPGAFELEKSQDGINWTGLGKVGSETNDHSEVFQFYDLDVVPAYYRVRQTDINGRTVYSEIKQSNCRSKSVNVALFPVPARDKLNVAILSDLAVTTELQVADISGRVVKHQLASLGKGTTNLVIDVSNLPGGEYVLKNDGKGIQVYRKFTVAR